MEKPIAPNKKDYTVYYIYKQGKVISFEISEKVLFSDEYLKTLNVTKANRPVISAIQEAGYIVEKVIKQDDYDVDLKKYRGEYTKYYRFLMENAIEDEGYKITPLTEYLYSVAQRNDRESIDDFVDVLKEVENITGIKFLKGFI